MLGDVRWYRVAGLVLLGLTLVTLASFGLAQDSGLGAISSALSSGEAEIRDGIFPAVVGILTAILLISVAAGVVHMIARNR